MNNEIDFRHWDKTRESLTERFIKGNIENKQITTLEELKAVLDDVKAICFVHGSLDGEWTSVWAGDIIKNVLENLNIKEK